MTPQEKQDLKNYLKSISEILVRNTPKENLKDFEGIELAIREHFLQEIGPEIADFFYQQQQKRYSGKTRKINSIVGKVKITSRQAEKLSFKKSTRNSPFLEKCCLLLTANCSFQNAELDLEKLTGIKVSSSSQHRLVEKYNFPETSPHRPLESLSLDGGKVRVRTPLGQESQWKDYKAISLHKDVCLAFFQNSSGLLDWINLQPLSRVITCVGDGHDGVWNLITQIGEKYQRREVLDWYHLMENLHKIDGHSQEVRAIKNHLWRGEIEEAIVELKTIKKAAAFNFRRYLYKHSSRIPDYSLYKELNICIGSGSVESTIKRIGARIKISGAQYLEKNVPQYLKLRCAYLNGAIL